MKTVDFYKKFNQIVSNHKDAKDTKEKLTKLVESIKGTDLENKVNIDLSIADELDKQKKQKETELQNLVKIEEDYDYDDSYEDSYDYDDSY